MNFSRFTTLAALVGASSMLTLQAAVKDLPVKNVNGRMYHYYVVPAKETVYSLLYKLDVTKDVLISNNPAVADGLKEGMTLFFPVEETKSQSSQSGKKVISYEVQKGETIFGIAQKYGISTEELIALNPVLKNGLKAGQTIRISVAADEPAAPAEDPQTPLAALQEPADEQHMEGYIVKKKETFYSIAKAHGLTVADLEAANPGVSSLRVGQVLNIPVKGPAHVSPVSDAVAVEETTVVPDEPVIAVAETVTPGSTVVTVAGTEAPVVSLAVMLPFMLNEESPSKNAQRYTEFYKGFLLAVDSLRANGTPIHITAYDTEGSVLKVREAISDPEFKKHTAIIAPDNAAQLAVLAEYGKNNNVKVFNTFIVRDDSYLNNPAVMQGNLPSALMYRKAVEALMVRLNYSTPVFVAFKDAPGDKTDFVDELRSALDAAGKKYVNMEVDGRLTTEQLASLDANGNYMFIPTSSRQADLNKIMPGIIEWRDQAITPMVRLFGYPEWTTFRGETLENMHNINTTVYSRFFTDENSARARDIDTKFKNWYGTRMENAVPRQGLLGFDTGMYVIMSLTGHPEGYDGVQNGYFYITPSPAAGAYNDALYFINYRSGNVIDKSRI